MSQQAWLIAGRSEAIIQPGQPPSEQAAWLLDIPAGSDALNTANNFATSQNFPIGTTATVVDLSTTPPTIRTFQLESSWVAQ